MLSESENITNLKYGKFHEEKEAYRDFEIEL